MLPSTAPDEDDDDGDNDDRDQDISSNLESSAGISLVCVVEVA